MKSKVFGRYFACELISLHNPALGVTVLLTDVHMQPFLHYGSQFYFVRLYIIFYVYFAASWRLNMYNITAAVYS